MGKLFWIVVFALLGGACLGPWIKTKMQEAREKSRRDATDAEDEESEERPEEDGPEEVQVY